MADIGELKLKVDDFIRQTRVIHCMMITCIHHDKGEVGCCSLKKIMVDGEGMCSSLKVVR